MFYVLFRERGREGGGRNIACLSHSPQTGELARNPGMCPDWESNQQPCSSQAGAQSTEPHQPGQINLNNHVWLVVVELDSAGPEKS